MKLARWLLISILPIAILLGSAHTIIFSQTWYRQEFETRGIYASFTTMSKQEIDHEAATIIAFLKNKQELHTAFLNEKEKKHMQDVRLLIKRYRAATLFSLLATLILLIQTRKDKKALLYAGFSSLIVLGVVLIAITTMFPSIFLMFHKLAFTNEFWLLDPATDNLIKLFPEMFFIDALKQIIKNSITISMMIIVIGSYRMYYALHKQKLYISKKRE